MFNLKDPGQIQKIISYVYNSTDWLSIVNVPLMPNLLQVLTLVHHVINRLKLDQMIQSLKKTHNCNELSWQLLATVNVPNFDPKEITITNKINI